MLPTLLNILPTELNILPTELYILPVEFNMLPVEFNMLPCSHMTEKLLRNRQVGYSKGHTAQCVTVFEL